MLCMVSHPHRPQSGHFTCYLNRTYHVLPTSLGKPLVHARKLWHPVPHLRLHVDESAQAAIRTHSSVADADRSTQCFRMSNTPFDSGQSGHGKQDLLSRRWRLPLAPTRASSAWSTHCCCALFPFTNQRS